MSETRVRYTYLTNCLVLFAAEFAYLKSIHKPDFDVEFELSSEFEIGLSIENINYLYNHNKITKSQNIAILEFRETLINVPDFFWSMQELECNPIWNGIRKQARNILDILGEDAKEYDFSIVKTI